MTEQERPPRTEPTTEAGRSIIGHDYRGNEVYTITREGVIAIEEAARTEGRQQAVPSVDVVIDILGDAESDGIIGPEYTPERLARYIVDSLAPDEDEVAGLNASESTDD